MMIMGEGGGGLHIILFIITELINNEQGYQPNDKGILVG